MNDKILCVDDDPSVLSAYQRRLRKDYNIDTADSGVVALEMLESRGPYAVIVADMRMPGMDGIQLLGVIKNRAPHVVRVMLTGNSDQQTAMDAVNHGHIFRFLTKPCPPETLTETLNAALEQHRLITAEKQLLENTLRGSVKVLTDVLSLSNPIAFGHASRVRRLVRDLCKHLEPAGAWQFEIAAMLSQIGCITLPSDALDKIRDGQTLDEDEARMYESHPSVGCDLVSNIPRLEAVAEIIEYQNKHYDGSGYPHDDTAEKAIPIGARILKVALDFDALQWSGKTDSDAISVMRERNGYYDPDILAVLETVVGYQPAFVTLEIDVDEITDGMILAEDVMTSNSLLLLVGKGQEVCRSLRQRLVNFAHNGKIRRQVRVLVPSELVSCIRGQNARQHEQEAHASRK